MKGTLKVNSVAEDEKSKLVPDEDVEAEPPPPLGFLSAMAAAHHPLHVSGSRCSTAGRKPVKLGANTLPHLRTRARTSGSWSVAAFLPHCSAAINQHGGAGFTPGFLTPDSLHVNGRGRGGGAGLAAGRGWAGGRGVLRGGLSLRL